MKYTIIDLLTSVLVVLCSPASTCCSLVCSTREQWGLPSPCSASWHRECYQLPRLHVQRCYIRENTVFLLKIQHEILLPELRLNIQHSIHVHILFPFIAYFTHDDLWKIGDYFQSFGKGCQIIRRAEFLGNSPSKVIPSCRFAVPVESNYLQ